ncbi:hypothetical protein VULLAG_LOCUS14614 [Vulpes lagopus]
MDGSGPSSQSRTQENRRRRPPSSPGASPGLSRPPQLAQHADPSPGQLGACKQCLPQGLQQEDAEASPAQGPGRRLSCLLGCSVTPALVQGWGTRCCKFPPSSSSYLNPL